MIDPRKPEIKFDINRLHKDVSDCNEEAMWVTAKAYNWNLLGKFEVCEDFAIGKVKK